LQDDPRLLLTWTRNSEVFAFVIYYSQLTTTYAQTELRKWTCALIDLAVVKNGGTYYLPYQLYATKEQFHKAYPRVNQWLEQKKHLDPENIFRNIFWQKYGGNSINGE
jgi:FAD/FMN-containing dehydrogenase